MHLLERLVLQWLVKTGLARQMLFKNPHTHYEYSEFHAGEVEAHICAAFMQKMKMAKLDSNCTFCNVNKAMIKIMY